jgi:DNA-binding NtrC family response regulator
MKDAARGVGRSGPTAITRSALEVMRAYHWPGNIRELRNVIDRALVLCSGGAIEPAHLPLERMQAPVLLQPPVPDAGPGTGTGAPSPDRRERVLRALDESGGNQTSAARLLEVSRRTLFNWMEELGISGPRKRRQ